MEKKCLWLEFEEMKNEVEELKGEKKRCKDEMDVRCCCGYEVLQRECALTLVVVNAAESEARERRAAGRSAREGDHQAGESQSRVRVHTTGSHTVVLSISAVALLVQENGGGAHQESARREAQAREAERALFTEREEEAVAADEVLLLRACIRWRLSRTRKPRPCRRSASCATSIISRSESSSASNPI